MQRYFLDSEYKGQTTDTITGEPFHHLSRVMRMKPGDEIWISYPGGKTARARITAVGEDAAEVEISGWEEQQKELPVKVAIASGLPKGDKLEWIIQKGTELGASDFIPFIASRSVVKWEEKKAAKKAERWRKIAKEAAEQSHRQTVPAVGEPVPFKKLLELAGPFDKKVAAFEEEAKQGERQNFARVLSETVPGDSVLIVFGPEGGLSDEEADRLKEAGFVLCGLGPRILRTETAPLYALAAISYHFELMR